MLEWHETYIKINDWLTNAEDEAAMFDQARETIFDVEDQVAEHEVSSERGHLPCLNQLIAVVVFFANLK